jgi:magnesium-transporting ATPase (P-type)
MIIIGLGIEGDDVTDIVDSFVTAIALLAESVPEGLQLTATLALAFSSGKIKEQIWSNI